MNTFLYNWEEERNDEVNKREKNTSATTTATAATTSITFSKALVKDTYRLRAKANSWEISKLFEIPDCSS